MQFEEIIWRKTNWEDGNYKIQNTFKKLRSFSKQCSCAEINRVERTNCL